MLYNLKGIEEIKKLLEFKKLLLFPCKKETRFPKFHITVKNLIPYLLYIYFNVLKIVMKDLD